MPRTYKHIRAKVILFGLSGKHFVYFLASSMFVIFLTLGTFTMFRFMVAIGIIFCLYVFFVWRQTVGTMSQKINSLPTILKNYPYEKRLQ